MILLTFARTMFSKLYSQGIHRTQKALSFKACIRPYWPKSVNTFEYYDKVNSVSLDGRSSILTLELSKLDKVVEKPAKKMSLQELWAVYFKYLTDKGRRDKINEIVRKDEGIAMASKVLMTISKDEAERFRLMSEEKNQLDIQSKMVTAKREGEQKGEKKIIDLLKSGKSPEEIIKSYKAKNL